MRRRPNVPLKGARVLLLAILLPVGALITSLHPSVASLIRANRMNVMTLKTVPVTQFEPGTWPECRVSRARPVTALAGEERVQGLAELRSQAYLRWLSQDCTGALERWTRVADREGAELKVSTLTAFWLGMTQLSVHGVDAEATSRLRQSRAAPYFAMLGEATSDHRDAAMERRWYELAFAVTPSLRVAEALSQIYSTNDQSQLARDTWARLAEAVETESEVWLQAQGEVSFLDGNWSRSAELFERALTMNPHNGVLVRKARRAYERAENWPEVVRTARQEIDLFPEREEPYLVLADALMQMAQFDQADAWLKLAAQRFPGSWYVPLRQGRLACARNQVSLAQEHFARASANSAPRVQVQQASQQCPASTP